jgi:hypothetical protein
MVREAPTLVYCGSSQDTDRKRAVQDTDRKRAVQDTDRKRAVASSQIEHVFWDVAPCGFLTTDVSEERIAFVFTVKIIGELGRR